MQFTAFFTLVLSAIGMLTIANADIVGFDGSECDGNEGLNVPCDGSCHLFGGRHSLLLLAGGTHCVTYYLNSDCTDVVGNAELSGVGTCANVNTGTNVQSFRCSSSSICNN